MIISNDLRPSLTAPAETAERRKRPERPARRRQEQLLPLTQRLHSPKARVTRLFAMTLLLCGLFGFTPVDVRAYQQSGSVTLPLFNGTPYYFDSTFCGGWDCRADLGCTAPVRYLLGYFNDYIPAVATLVTASLTWRTGNDKQFTWQTIPTISIDLNGVGLGTPQTITNFASCSPSTAMPFTFESTYPNGFPGYVRRGPSSSGQNSIYLTMMTTNSGVAAGDSNGATITLIYNMPPPFEFSVTDQAPESERRVILTNSHQGYPYPQFQSQGGRDGEVPLFVRARGGDGTFQPNITVYLRVVDPADTAPHMNLPQNPLAHVIDNVGSAATLAGNAITAAPNYVGVWQGTSNAGGELDFTLKLPINAASGDNYQIEAAFDPTFPAGTTVKSGSLTAWKRVFVEKHRMLRNGIFLTADSAQGSSTLTVAGNLYGGNQGGGRIRAGDRIIVAHAPAVDRSNVQNGWYSEEHDVASVTAAPGGGYVITLGRKNGNTVTLQPLSHSFGRDPSPASGPQLADAIAKLSAATLSSADYFDSVDDLVTNSVFPEAFTEYYILPYTSFTTVPVPYYGTFQEPDLQQFGEKWATIVEPTPNHQLLFIGDSDRSSAPSAGVTISHVSGKTSSWVFRGTIETQVNTPGTVNYHQSAELWVEKTEAHEVAHEWQANVTMWPLQDHCPASTRTYDNSTLYCLLAANDPQGAETQRTNGIARFHLLPVAGGGWHSEYLEIRKRPDPFMP